MILVRHGEAQNNLNHHLVGGRSDRAQLSERGRLQASSLAHRLRQEGYKPDLLMASEADRAIDTARILAPGLDIPPAELVIHPRLHEWDQGEWEGKVRKEVYEPHLREQMFTDPLNFQPPGGETPGAVEERMWNWLNHDLRERFPEGGKVLAVSHGMAIRCLIRRVLQTEPVMVFRMITHNTSLNVLEWDGERWWLERLNDHAHLSGTEVIGPY